MSRVFEYPALPSPGAVAHFREALSIATDPSDVHADMESGHAPFVVVDARSPESFSRGHVPGAVNLPHRRIDATTAARLGRDRLVVTYCDGIGCNASTRAALRFAELGFAVKEMLGGIDWWIRDGYPVETGGGAEADEPADAESAAGEAASNAAGETGRHIAGASAGNVACGCGP